MAKLTRVAQKIFGVNAGANQRAKIGSLSAGSPVFTTDPAVMQSLSNYESGWYSVVVGANSPAIQDMNALDNLITRQLAYLYQNGVPEWDSSTTYYIGSIVADPATGSQFTTPNLYYSFVDNNTGNALSDTTKWARIAYGSRAALAGTWLFNGGGAVASSTAAVYASRSGNNVIVTCKPFLAITGGVGSITQAAYSLNLPADLRPTATTGTVTGQVFVTDNGTTQTLPGRIEITTAGAITIFKNSTNSTWTGSAVNANSGLAFVSGFSYVLWG